jgi:predicted HAD superfamily Cof-like phosphohydrolase
MREFKLRASFGSPKETQFMLRFWVESFMEAFCAAYKDDAHGSLKLRNQLEETLNRREVNSENFTPLVDAMLNLVYTTLHTLVEFGVPVEEALDVMISRHRQQRLGGFTYEGKMVPRRFESSDIVERFVKKIRREAERKKTT